MLARPSPSASGPSADFDLDLRQPLQRRAEADVQRRMPLPGGELGPQRAADRLDAVGVAHADKSLQDGVLRFPSLEGTGLGERLAERLATRAAAAELRGSPRRKKLRREETGPPPPAAATAATPTTARSASEQPRHSSTAPPSRPSRAAFDSPRLAAADADRRQATRPPNTTAAASDSVASSGHAGQGRPSARPTARRVTSSRPIAAKRADARPRRATRTASTRDGEAIVGRAWRSVHGATRYRAADGTNQRRQRER